MDSNLIQKHIDLSFAEDLHADSRVWIYHADRVFADEEVQHINADIQSFCTQWVSHTNQLKARGKVLLNRIILSGCSIDTSVAFVKNLGLKYQTDLFDRMLITYLEGDSVKTTKLNDLGTEMQGDKSEVLVFDNLIKTKKDLSDKSIVPVSDTWVERFI